MALRFGTGNRLIVESQQADGFFGSNLRRNDV